MGAQRKRHKGSKGARGSKTGKGSKGVRGSEGVRQGQGSKTEARGGQDRVRAFHTKF